MKAVYDCEDMYSFWYDIIDDKTDEMVVIFGDVNAVNIDKTTGKILDTGLYLPGKPFWNKIENSKKIILDDKKREIKYLL